MTSLISKNEVEMLAKMKGLEEGFPKVYDTYETGDFTNVPHNLTYIVTNILGNSIWDLFDHHTHLLSLLSACQIGIQVTENLKKLHEQGLVHGDIKPDNILIAKEYCLGLKLRNTEKNR